MKPKFEYLIFLFLGLIPAILSAQQVNEEAAEWMKNHALSPDKYIIEKFQTHDVVLLGEHHVVKENLLFVQDLIPKLYQNGVYNLGMEFGASEFQKELDELINAAEYDEEKAKAIMFAYNVAWGFREYLDVYKSAWKLNRSLPYGTEKFRVLNLSYVFDWEKFSGERTPESMKMVFNKGTADKYRAEIIEQEIIAKNEKILVLVGTPHAYTRYGSPYFKYNGDNFCEYDFDWLGNRLYKKYPEKVFNIILHQAFTQKENNNYFLISPSGGAIELLMKENAGKPAGFDLTGTPVGKLPDNSINSMCYENFTLEQYFDGYIFLQPLRELEGCTVIDDFVNERNFEYALKNFPDPDWHEKITTLDALKRFIKSNSERISIQYQAL
ncbi:MAG: ChaN family lipoprotein [Lentimicrobium sp.]